MKHLLTRTSTLVLAVAIMLVATATSFAQATIVIQNADTAGVGFNDPGAPDAASTLGGNPGSTIGEQRMIVFQTAASIWGAALKSTPTITIRASWSTTQICTATSGTLGSAGNSGNIWRDFSGTPAPVPGHWYGNALANAISGIDRNDTIPGGTAGPEINATFNLRLGTTGCLETAHWYYGLDNNHGPTGIDLLNVVLHEFGHGLGFQTYTNTTTGVQAGSTQTFPTIFDKFLFDDTQGLAWDAMTDSQRQSSAINTGKLVWIGPIVDADVPRGVLSGTPRLRVNSPASIAGNYQVFTADFGPALTASGVAGPVIQTVPNDGCSAITNALTDKIAFIDRGTCNFTVKVKNAQNAGAIGVIIADNAGNPNGPLTGLGGSDNTITIPAVGISVADGNTIRAQLASPGVSATLLLDNSRFAGTDAAGRPLMYAPNPLEGGSSVSHWDKSLSPNQLMEPSNSADLTHNVRTPADLTLSLLQDIGWPINANPAPRILIEQGTANTALALDSVTFTRGPFTVTNVNNFSSDGRRRLVIFITPELPANPTVTVTANGIPLTVESFGIWNALAGTSYIVVALPSLPGGGTTYALSVTVNGLVSTNSPTITIQ